MKILDFVFKFVEFCKKNEMEQGSEERKLKHLEFIQNVVNRLETNSFLVKNWCITLITGLVTATLVLSDGDEIKSNVILSLIIPVLIFWFLGTYYLWQGRKFRGLYNKVATQHTYEINFSMDISEFKYGKYSFINVFLSKTVSLFYVSILAALFLVYIQI